MISQRCPDDCVGETLTNSLSKIVQTCGGKVRKSCVKSKQRDPQRVSRVGAEKDVQQHAKEMASLGSS